MSDAVPGSHILTKQDLRAAAGRAIICGFEGATVTAELKEILREVRPLGLILFARNIESPEQVSELIRELKDLRKDEPLLISVDQEGGRVQRIKQPATVWPAMRDIAMLEDEALFTRVGLAMGRELRAMSFDVDYAPVLDVDTNPKNPIIGDRAFGDTAARVRRFAVAYLRGLTEAGIGGCGKHFPGHGDTDLDSHLALPKVEHEMPRLREVEWPPFKAAIDAGVGAIMTAHVVVAALDEKVPATFSKRALDVLREDLGFGGVIISDDIEMKAVADHFAPREMAELGVKAGIDLFLSCKRYEVTLELFRALVQQVEDKRVSHARVIASDKRNAAWRLRFYKPATRLQPGSVGTMEHQAIVEEIATRLQRG